LYTELFYAIIPTLLSYFFVVLLSLHHVTFLTFFIAFEILTGPHLSTCQQYIRPKLTEIS